MEDHYKKTLVVRKNKNHTTPSKTVCKQSEGLAKQFAVSLKESNQLNS